MTPSGTDGTPRHCKNYDSENKDSCVFIQRPDGRNSWGFPLDHGELARGEGFPTAIALGPRTLRYRKDEFYSWCEARRAAAKPARSNYSPVKRDEPSRFRAIVVAA